jgi:hypothetical protein
MPAREPDATTTEKKSLVSWNVRADTGRDEGLVDARLVESAADGVVRDRVRRVGLAGHGERELEGAVDDGVRRARARGLDLPDRPLVRRRAVHVLADGVVEGVRRVELDAVVRDLRAAVAAEGPRARDELGDVDLERLGRQRRRLRTWAVVHSAST